MVLVAAINSTMVRMSVRGLPRQLIEIEHPLRSLATVGLRNRLDVGRPFPTGLERRSADWPGCKVDQFKFAFAVLKRTDFLRRIETLTNETGHLRSSPGVTTHQAPDTAERSYPDLKGAATQPVKLVAQDDEKALDRSLSLASGKALPSRSSGALLGRWQRFMAEQEPSGHDERVPGHSIAR